MPDIPWAVGEKETVNAAKYSGDRRLKALSQWGEIAGTGVRLYQNQKETDEQIERDKALAAEYDRLDNQTAKEEHKPEEDRKPVSSTSVSKVADAAEEDPMLGGFSSGESRPGEYQTDDQSHGVATPGAARQDVQTSQQVAGSKPATVTQKGATSETEPMPATRDESADDQQKALYKVATSPKNLGAFVSGVGDTIAGGAKDAYHAVGNLGGGRFWQRLGNIVGMEDPERQGKLVDLARFKGRALLRGEQDKRAASLSGLAAGMPRPFQALKEISPYVFRNMDPTMERIQSTQSAEGRKSGDLLGFLYEAAGGDKNPEHARRKAIGQYMEIEAYLNDLKKTNPKATVDDLIFKMLTSPDPNMRKKGVAVGEVIRRMKAKSGGQADPFGNMPGMEGLGSGGEAAANDPAEMQSILDDAFGTGSPARGGNLPTPPAGEGGAPSGGHPSGAGSVAKRHNNPGNIKDSAFARSQPGYLGPGDEATDGGRFARFDTVENGAHAMTALLGGPGYRGLTVDAALKRWSNSGYGGELAQQAGIDPNRLMHTLSEVERMRLVRAMVANESGGDVTLPGDTQVASIPPQPAGETAAGTPPPEVPAAAAEPAPPPSPEVPLEPGQVRVEPEPPPPVTTTTTPRSTTTTTTEPGGGVKPEIWELYYHDAEQLPPGQFPPWHPLGEGGLPTLPPGIPPAWPPLAGFAQPESPKPERPLSQLAAGGA